MNDLDSKLGPFNSLGTDGRNDQSNEKRLRSPIRKYYKSFLILSAIILVSLSLLMSYRVASQLEAKIANLTLKLEEELLEDETSIAGLHDKIGSIEDSITSRISTLEGEIEAGERRFNQKMGQVDWLSFEKIDSLNHVQRFITRSYQVLHGYRDKDHAILLLKTAKEILESVEIDESQNLIERISAQEQELENLEVVNFGIIYRKLEALSALVDGWQPLKKKLSPNSAPSDTGTIWEDILQALDRLFVVRVDQSSTKRLILSDEIDVSLLKLEWKLHLQEMRFAVASENQFAYSESLRAFERAVGQAKLDIYDINSFQSLIKQLAEYEIGALEFDLDVILDELKELKSISS